MFYDDMYFHLDVSDRKQQLHNFILTRLQFVF